MMKNGISSKTPDLGMIIVVFLYSLGIRDCRF